MACLKIIFIQPHNTLGLHGKQHMDPQSPEPLPVITQQSHNFKGRLHAQSENVLADFTRAHFKIFNCI
jgi:hypothetical protein